MSEANFAEIAARNKLGESDEWQAFRWEVIDKNVYKITGGIPKLKKNGRRSWAGAKRSTSYVHQSELEAEKVKYSLETGNCAECEGKGKVFWSHSSEKGSAYRDCSQCGGTGKAT